MIYERLAAIQRELKAPKGQFNTFGKYKYRSCEDILEAVKPLLGDAVLMLTDDLVHIGDRYYIRATAELQQGDERLSVTAYAREEADKKGMDAAQITGAVSSYARKYALNGLFLIDDCKDPDTADNTKEKKGGPKDAGPQPAPPASPPPPILPNAETGKADEPLAVGTELRTKVDSLIDESGVDKLEFRQWLLAIKRIGKKFGNPSLSTMSVKTAESMIAVWPQTLKAFNLWLDKQNAQDGGV